MSEREHWVNSETGATVHFDVDDIGRVMIDRDAFATLLVLAGFDVDYDA